MYLLEELTMHCHSIMKKPFPQNKLSKSRFRSNQVTWAENSFQTRSIEVTTRHLRGRRGLHLEGYALRGPAPHVALHRLLQFVQRHVQPVQLSLEQTVVVERAATAPLVLAAARQVAPPVVLRVMVLLLEALAAGADVGERSRLVLHRQLPLRQQGLERSRLQREIKLTASAFYVR